MKAKIIKTGEIVDVYHEPQHGQVSNIYKESVFVNGRMWQENELEFIESKNVDLEKAAKQYEEDAVFYATRNISDFFKAGAKWYKQYLMKDAVEIEYGWIKPIIYASTEKSFNIGSDDKVKLIIIKEN